MFLILIQYLILHDDLLVILLLEDLHLVQNQPHVDLGLLEQEFLVEWRVDVEADGQGHLVHLVRATQDVLAGVAPGVELA